METRLIALPLPLLAFCLSAAAFAMVLRRDFGVPSARAFFAAFFAVIALGGLLVGLRFGYGIIGLVPLQRALPLLAGPLLYLGFISFQRTEDRLRKPAIGHLGLALAIGLMPQILPAARDVFDWFIGLSYAGYTALLLALWRGGPNQMIRARLESADWLSRMAGWGAGFLMIFLVFDTAIAVAFARDRGALAVTLISYGSIVLMALLLFAIATLSARPKPAPAPPTRSENEIQAMATLIAAADALISREELFLDTGLTAERLARRLHVPVRALSEAVNLSTGMNLSQYVNGFRLRRAAELLVEEGGSIRDVMERSGFLTRSNFYREFQREYGQSPATYRRAVSASKSSG
ncbi:MAG: AraC family transcriptional regulator [Albidovulum sp.]|uniref:helix-turn-helix domain-containing protein n=1 Tax=Albidovulum sp. TaxID=1872424 RepID=UPI003CBBECCE